MLPTINRLPASVAASASTGPASGCARVRQQQHHRGHVRDEVRQHDGDGEQAARVGEVHARGVQRGARARGEAGSASAWFTTNRPMNSTSSCQSTRPIRSREAIRRLVSRTRRAASASTSRGTGAKRKPSTSSARTRGPSPSATRRTAASVDRGRLPVARPAAPHRAAGSGARPRRSPTQRRQRGVGRKPANESRSVWPISMFCGLPISVAAEPTFAAQASASRNGSGSSFAARAALDEQRRHREAHDVVREHRRERPGDGHDQQREQRGGRDVGARDPARDPGVEAAEPELRRDHHQPEEQRERRHVDRAPRRRPA